MKNLILALSFIFVSTSYAGNLSAFNGKNFDPLSGSFNKCGVHLEVAGSAVIVTDIAPPAKDANRFCSHLSSGCSGFSAHAQCNNEGSCVKDGEIVLQLLPDGNIYFPKNGSKYLQSASTSYSWCEF